MVYHKEMLPGEHGIKMNQRRLTLTKAVLAEVNTAATLKIKDGSKWVPLEFLHSKDRPTVELNIAIDPAETLFFRVEEKGYIGPETRTVINGVSHPTGGNVKIHLFGNLTTAGSEGSEQPPAKRARGAEEGFP